MRLSFTQFILNEVDIIDKFHDTPLKDTDTIRVYHAFNRLDDAILACEHGLSGKTYAKRIYSYEANNNPKGLFITPDLKTAKEFGRVIIEFNTRVSDLEAPVWPNGSYTVQGQMSANFKDNDEREQRRLSNREELKNSPHSVISQSDRPELAHSLLVSGERQALFVGDLNANSISHVWVSSELLNGDASYTKAFTRLDRQHFLKLMHKDKDSTEERGRNYHDDANPNYKLFSPREDFSPRAFETRVRAKYKTIPLPEIIKILKSNPDYILKFFWPKQIPEVKKYLEINQ